MSKQAQINCLDFAEKSQEIHGTINPFALPRLAEALHGVAGNSEAGKLRYSLKGRVNEEGKRELALRVAGEFNLICQRCLGALGFVHDHTTRFVLVSSEEDMPLPQDEPDAVEYLIAEPRMPLEPLVEEEVLLSLPLSPMHAACAPQFTDGRVPKESPFKVLQGFKKGSG